MPDLQIADFTYELPEDKIARQPLPQRDAARLLAVKNGQIEDRHFYELPQLLPANGLVFFNQTKVVQARLLFQKRSGGLVEIFCLEPHERYADVATAMAQHSCVWWRCMVGGASKWKPGMLLQLWAGDSCFTLTASLVERGSNDFVIELRWDNEALSFAAVLDAAGAVPLPPYMHRRATAEDKERYQTIFANEEGSVAAPTASLHFTPEVITALAAKGIETGKLTLHVGAGTFKPVKSETIAAHEMHAEWMEISGTAIAQLLQHSGPVIAAGTTALRTLESLYHIGCKAARSPDATPEQLWLGQWEVYEKAGEEITGTAALQALLQWLDARGLERLVARTQILIAPGYRFRIVDGLITNFHQPKSTLLLLVAAFIGDEWKDVYNHALKQDYRFLSYGDASLLWRAR